MKTLIAILAFMPVVGLAQPYPSQVNNQRFRDPYAEPIVPIIPLSPPLIPAPVLQPPPNPWGTGYSTVEIIREKPDLLGRLAGDRDATYQEKTYRVVPNNALGQPVMPLEW